VSGLPGIWPNVVLTLFLVVIVAAARVIAVPGSIFDQDEAYLAAAVSHLDLTHNQPHPPWFPLWILIGKALHGIGLESARALQVASLAFSVWVVIPLTALWSRLLRPPLALAGSLLYLATPLAWMMSGRAYTETASTALLVLTLAWWLNEPLTPRAAAFGSLAGGGALLIRPQVGLGVVVALVLTSQRSRGKVWRELTLPFGVAVTAGAAGLLVVAGGPTGLVAALTTHAEMHFGQLGLAERGLFTTGLGCALGHPAAAAAWVSLAAVGAMASRHQALVWPRVRVVVGTLLALGFTMFALSDPGHARYAMPLLALASGLCLAGCACLVGTRGGVAVAAVAAGASAVVVVPQLELYRSATSPVLAALRQGDWEADRRGAVMVVDRTLSAFVQYEQAAGRLRQRIVLDQLIEEGVVSPPPARYAVAVFAADHGSLVSRSENVSSFACEVPLVRALNRRRFCAVTVAAGAELANRAPPGRPVVIID
jgi:hypothetical protein